MNLKYIYIMCECECVCTHIILIKIIIKYYLMKENIFVLYIDYDLYLNIIKLNPELHQHRNLKYLLNKY